MKRILLASASIVAFAGAASAQNIVFGGDAELGFNDDEEDGFFYSANLNVTFAAELAPELARMAGWLGLERVVIGERGAVAAPLRELHPQAAEVNADPPPAPADSETVPEPELATETP